MPANQKNMLDVQEPELQAAVKYHVVLENLAPRQEQQVRLTTVPSLAFKPSFPHREEASQC